MVSIYTKKGDSGKTQLVDGSNVGKNHLALEAYGAIDELNSFVGNALACVSEKHSPAEFAEMSLVLEKIQRWLFVLGSNLACPPEKRETFKLVSVNGADLSEVEAEIDKYQAQLSPLSTFILPGGSELGARLHLCRTVCRRAERNMASLETEGPSYLPEFSIPFINRLSDYFFVASRLANKIDKVEEISWP